MTKEKQKKLGYLLLSLVATGVAMVAVSHLSGDQEIRGLSIYVFAFFAGRWAQKLV